jgi:hypothetical protein
MRLIAILALATLILAPFTAQAQRPFYPDTYVWIDSVTVTADTALASINTAYAEQVIISLELEALGGSGTYCPILMTSIDGSIWDSVRTDTLTAAGQNVLWTLSVYDAIKTGGGGNTAAGANTASVALSNYLKIAIDEIGASTGSGLTAKAYLRNTKHFKQ